MRLSIRYKIFLAILSAHLIVYISTYGAVRYNFNKGFLEYISRIEERQVPALVTGLTDFYEHTGSWETLKKNPSKWVDLVFESIESSEDPDRLTRRNPRLAPNRSSANDWYYTSEYSPARPHLLLLDHDKNVLFGNPAALPLANLTPIELRDQVVGYIAVTSRQELSERADVLFAEQQQRSFQIFASLMVLVSAILVAFPMASILVRPVHDLVAGTRALIMGEYGSRIKPRGSDELSQLAHDFNTLAKTLEQNRAARQQWIADISHELRTPLAILRGELESLQDGIRPLSRESLDSLHHEVVHLNALVNDLHELSMSDLGALIYQKEEVNLGELIERSLEMNSQQLGKQRLEVDYRLQPLNGQDDIQVLADLKRLAQLFTNLVQNTSRYTDEGGRLVIQVRENSEDIEIDWYDSEPGVSDQDLEHLFDRLYRVDSSRNRQKGGSGLGLTICKNIVEAHEGSISASHSPLGGLRLKIHLPRKRKKSG